MKITIIPIDGAIYVDGQSFSGLDLSTCQVPPNVHALQWKDTKGWIEYLDNEDGTKPANEEIIELPKWANTCKTKWDEEKVTQESFQVATQEELRNGLVIGEMAMVAANSHS